ncbi:MAG: hypothetical protein HY676_04710 [Chloroflexi bacterium]|nr:hypothetical protein [Chloroflexota bacterium]
MDTQHIAQTLETFASRPYALSVSEVVDYTQSDIDTETVRRALANDSRYISLCREKEDWFVPEKTLFLWFVSLNIRMAQAHKARLTERELTRLMNSLRPTGRWEFFSKEALHFGERFGFVGPAWTPAQYCFPLAHILSYLSLFALEDATKLLKSLADIEVRATALNQPLEEALGEALSKLERRLVQVVLAREGFGVERRMTLEEIGSWLGVTRERVRQLEDKARKRFIQRYNRRVFLRAFLCDVMRAEGSLVVVTDSLQASLRRFAAKCAGIPIAELPELKIVILGASSKDVQELGPWEWHPHEVDPESIAKFLDSKGNLCLLANDVKTLAESATQPVWSRVTKAQKVYTVLRHIGRPAHYSEISLVYNSMFPDDPSSERNIHAVLSREQHGMVWIGVKGKFALTEWGYEHPSIPLFDAVAEIVERKFKETGKPVHLTVITGELGKYRKVVSSGSLTFATQLNPGLRRVSSDSFVPKESADAEEEDVSSDKLDKTLRNFEKRNDS